VIVLGLCPDNLDVTIFLQLCLQVFWQFNSSIESRWVEQTIKPTLTSGQVFNADYSYIKSIQNLSQLTNF